MSEAREPDGHFPNDVDADRFDELSAIPPRPGERRVGIAVKRFKRCLIPGDGGRQSSINTPGADFRAAVACQPKRVGGVEEERPLRELEQSGKEVRETLAKNRQVDGLAQVDSPCLAIRLTGNEKRIAGGKRPPLDIADVRVQNVVQVDAGRRECRASSDWR